MSVSERPTQAAGSPLPTDVDAGVVTGYYAAPVHVDNWRGPDGEVRGTDHLYDLEQVVVREDPATATRAAYDEAGMKFQPGALVVLWEVTGDLGRARERAVKYGPPLAPAGVVMAVQDDGTVAPAPEVSVRQYVTGPE